MPKHHPPSPRLSAHSGGYIGLFLTPDAMANGCRRRLTGKSITSTPGSAARTRCSCTNFTTGNSHLSAGSISS